jgi:FKBP-type peptidyl-prolyl cis-trans isomerase SlyD
MMQVSDKTVVSIRYRMKNSRGEILENTLESAAIQYLHGVGSILPSLEVDLAGLKAGDERAVFISKEQGEGQMDDDFYIEVVIDGVRSATEEELRKGSPMQSTSQPDCGPGCCC